MSDEQLGEFEKLIDANDEAGALHWLETNRPNYKDVVAEELERLKQEIVANEDAILDASAAQSQQAPGPDNQGSQDQGDPTELQIR